MWTGTKPCLPSGKYLKHAPNRPHMWEYIIVSGSVDKLEEFEEKVSNLLNSDFNLEGELVVNQGQVFQSMKKYEYVKPDITTPFLKLSKNELKEQLKQKGLPVSGSKAQLVARLTEGDVAITVDCKISGQNADFEYNTDNTLAQLIIDLQETAMAWAPGKAPENAGITVDGGEGVSYTDNQSGSLASIGVSDNSVIAILADISQAA